MRLTQQHIFAELKEIRQDVQALRLEIDRYKGYAGGVFWVLGAAFTAVQFLFSWLRGGAQ